MNSLRSRIFVFFLALLLLVLGLILAMVYRTTYDHTLSQIQEQLGNGYRVFENELESRRQFQGQVTETIAKDFGFKGEVADAQNPNVPKDTQSLRETLENFRLRSRASLALAASADGHVLASTLAEARPGDSFPFPQLIRRDATEANDGLVPVGDRLFHVSIVPVFGAPSNLIGWLVLGYGLDDDASKHLARLIGADLSLIVRDDQGQPRVIASSVEGEMREHLSTLSGLPAGNAGIRQINGRDFVLYSAALGEAVTVVLQRSLTEALSDYQVLQWQLVAIVLAALALSGLGAFFVANSVSRPLSLMSEYVRRIGAGDYQAEPPPEHRGEIGILAREFSAMQDGIAEREAAITHLAFHDSLTGLANRNQFQRALAAALSDAGSDTRLAVLVMDLDHFKDINDTLGHIAGDGLLKQAAQRLERICRPGDQLARLGGDEFAILLNNIEVRDVIPLTLHYRDAFAEAFALEGIGLDINATVGIAVYPDHGEQPGTLLQRAEIAMYIGKEKHLAYCLYNIKQDRHSLLRLSLMGELRSAIERDELVLHYQPKLHVASHEIAGVECLVRWIHPVHGFIPPDDFIPLAEQTGNVRHLTNWVLETAMAQARCWREAGLNLRCAVNVSAVDLLDPAFTERVQQMLARHRLAPDALVLEVTESAVMEDPNKAVALLAQFHTMGIRLSIDDYGTGYSSMAQLKRLPVHELKIDKSFVLDVVNNPDDAIIVRSTIELGHNMGLSVVAEGVENAQALELLRQHGCDYAQGYHLSKPLPVADFERWLAQAPWPPRKLSQETKNA